MSFPLSTVPTALLCPDCGAHVRQVDRATGFEILVAGIVKGELSPPRKEGCDIENSELFPGLTFQVKFANARKRPAEDKTISGRDVHVIEGRQWTWSEGKASNPDFYVLFGVKEDQVFPFIVPRYLWKDHSSCINNGKGGRIKIIRAYEYSPCGRYDSSYKRNTFWQFYVKPWPEDLLFRIQYYIEHAPVEQGLLL